MDHKEIKNQLTDEFEKIQETTVQRLVKEYARERVDLKIDKAKSYPRNYSIKTAGKNNWIIFLTKPPFVNKYRGINDTTVCAIAYHYNKKGIRVFYPKIPQAMLVYNGHLFKRYNERLNLNITETLDIVKHFFENNENVLPSFADKDAEIYMMGFMKNGILLGEFQNNHTWLVWKTFISSNLARADQDELEKELIEQLQGNIEQMLQSSNMNKVEYGS